jgi:transposase
MKLRCRLGKAQTRPGLEQIAVSFFNDPSLTAAGSGEEVVPASEYRTLQNQVRELHRLLGKKTLEAEILKEALEHATGSKKQLRLPPSPPKDGSR